MDFPTAIKTCFNKYADFDGKASRSEFWFFTLFISFFYSFFYLVSAGIFIRLSLYLYLEDPVVIFYSLQTICLIALLIPHVAVAARRLHDIGMSGWWQLVPIYNIVLYCTDSISKSEGSRTTSYSVSKQKLRSGKTDITDELEELQELYEDGTLSEAQFKKAKEKLLK